MSQTVIVNEGVGEIRRRPEHESEQVSQVLLGTSLKVLSWRDKERWCRVEAPDGYRGWVRSWSVVRMTRAEAAAYVHGPLVEVDSMVARVRERATSRSHPLREATLGSRLRRVGRSGNWIRVLLPDGIRGYLHARDLLVDRRTLRPRQRPKDIPYLLRTAHRFLGVPYQWGGVTAKGIDCSGLVQTVFRLHGVSLPRDSKDQYRWVKSRAYIAPDPTEAQFGHLLFFGDSARAISHVAMGLGDGCYLHARGRVRINALRPDHPDFDRDLFRIYRGAGPVLLR
jgi:cell wall-associated NlpC family hydrolase